MHVVTGMPLPEYAWVLNDVYMPDAVSSLVDEVEI